jgi:putative hydrolase of the HAD superfamily
VPQPRGPIATRLPPPRAVTFDCWGTLIWEPNPGVAHTQRVSALWRAVRAVGRDISEEEAMAALRRAWERHVRLWQQGVASGAPEMTRWALEALAVPTDGVAEPLTREMAEASLAQEVRMLEGARDTLERLAECGIRRALICDTGFSPGRVVRQLLDRHGLLAWLEVQVFSNEAGVPKPDPAVFRAALSALDVEPSDAVHVGDLRRTDIAGAQAFGMRAVRIRAVQDDASEGPEGDAIADSHEQLCEILVGEP